MRASERREVVRALSLVQTGDRAGAISALRALSRRPAPHLNAGEQLVLSLVEFHCDRFDVEMSVRDCLEMRGKVWPSGRRKGKASKPQCAACEQGLRNASACPGVELKPPTQPPECLPVSQRLAKRARALVGLGPDESVGLDPFKEVNLDQPQDENDWRS